MGSEYDEKSNEKDKLKQNEKDRKEKDIFSDPNFREYIYDKIAEFANEKMMQAKLEKITAKFEAKYGIKLKLRAFDEINKDAKEYNDTEQARIDLLISIAKRAYEYEVNRFSKSRILSDQEMDVISRYYHDMTQEMLQDYYNKNPGVVYSLEDISVQLSTLDKYNFVHTLSQVLSAYPVSYIRSLGIEYIDSGSNSGKISPNKNFKSDNFGVSTSGSSDGVRVGINRNVYLDYTHLPFDDLYKSQEANRLAAVLSHELSHVKDNKNTNDIQIEMLEDWRQKSLGLGAQDYVGDYWKQMPENATLIGFANNYGVSNPAEDRATISEMFWANPVLLSDRCKQDYILAAKVKLLKGEFAKEHSAFNDTYWKLLQDNKVEEARKYVEKVDRDLELEKKFGKK